MKRYVWLVTVLFGGVSLCSAQEAKPAAKPAAKPEVKQEAKAEAKPTEEMGGEMSGDIMQEASPWQVSMGLIYKNWLYEHDGLQQRVPATSDKATKWEEGDTDGNGWGLQARIGRGDGRLNVTYMKSDFKFLLVTPGARHQIDTIARDFEVSWSQIRGRNNQAEWGSTLGFRYLGTQKKVTVTEGTKTLRGPANVNWMMLLGGYDGNWRPFDTPVCQLHGFIHFFIGEADGTARSGTDEDWTDGLISETYAKEYSLGYGARASFGADISITKQFRMSIDYMREWLYSFDSTDTGIVVFPDNADALFIENHHALVVSFNYHF